MIEYVLWKDAVSVDPWTHVDEIKPTYHLIETVGFIVKESNEAVVVALSHDMNSNNYCCFIHIPKEMVVLRKKLPIIKKVIDQRSDLMPEFST